MWLPTLLLRADLQNFERRQTREYSHTVLFKAVCHLIQKVQSEHVQADLYKRKKEIICNCYTLEGGRRKGNEKHHTLLQQ